MTYAIVKCVKRTTYLFSVVGKPKRVHPTTSVQVTLQSIHGNVSEARDALRPLRRSRIGSTVFPLGNLENERYVGLSHIDNTSYLMTEIKLGAILAEVKLEDSDDFHSQTS